METKRKHNKHAITIQGIAFKLLGHNGFWSMVSGIKCVTDTSKFPSSVHETQQIRGTRVDMEIDVGVDEAGHKRCALTLTGCHTPDKAWVVGMLTHALKGTGFAWNGEETLMTSPKANVSLFLDGYTIHLSELMAQ